MPTAVGNGSSRRQATPSTCLSDTAKALRIECLTCHGVTAHRFVPVAQTCAQSGCHEQIKFQLGKMAGQTSQHCTDVPRLHRAGRRTGGTRQREARNVADEHELSTLSRDAATHVGHSFPRTIHTRRAAEIVTTRTSRRRRRPRGRRARTRVPRARRHADRPFIAALRRARSRTARPATRRTTGR